MRTPMVAAAITAAAMMFSGSAVARADTTVTVTPTDLAAGTHWFAGDTRPDGTGVFRNGPLAPPLGTGSFELTTPSGPAKAQLLTNLFNRTGLPTINGIGFSTYQDYASTALPAMVGINLRVDFNNDTVPDNYMVYEPYQDLGNAALSKGVWQTWDAYRGGAAKWWISGGSVNGVTNPCPQSLPCTFAQIASLYPLAGVREDAACGGASRPCGSFGLNQGSGNPGVTSDADGLYISTLSGGKTTYNFEAAPADTTPPSCGAFVIHRGAHDTADVTVSDSGSGIASITNFTVTNGTASIPSFSAGAPSVTVTANKSVQGVNTHFEFDVTDVAGNTQHCV